MRAGPRRRLAPLQPDRRRLGPSGALLLGLLVLAGCAGSGTQEAGLVFTAIPDDNAAELVRKFTPVADYLAHRLGVPVRYVPSSDYGASVEMFKNGDVQLAWFGGLTGVQARAAVPGARAIAQGREDPNYRSYFIAHAGSGLQPADSFPVELADHSFTFGSPMSTSGRLMPEYFIRKHTGKAPREFFHGPFGFSGSHDRTIEQVAAGAFDAGAVNYRTFDDWVREGRVDTTRVRVIWVTPPFPDYNFTVHPMVEERFGAGFTERLQQALLDLQDPALLSGFRRSGFVPARNEDFAAVEQVARELGMVR